MFRLSVVFVTAVVYILQVPGQPQQKPQFLNAQVGPGQVRVAPFGVGRLNEGFQHVQGGALNPVAQHKLLAARKAIHGRHQPQQKAIMRLQRRSRFPRPVPKRPLPRPPFGRLCLQLTHSPTLTGPKKFDQGLCPWNPEVKR